MIHLVTPIVCIIQRDGSIPPRIHKTLVVKFQFSVMVLSSYLNPLSDFRFLLSRNYIVDPPKRKGSMSSLHSLLKQLLLQDPPSVPSSQMSPR